MLATECDALLYRAPTPHGQICSWTRFERSVAVLASAGRGRKALRRRAQPIATENIDRRRDHQQGETDHDRDKADRNQNECGVALGIDPPMMDRRQYKGQTGESRAT